MKRKDKLARQLSDLAPWAERPFHRTFPEQLPIQQQLFLPGLDATQPFRPPALMRLSFVPRLLARFLSFELIPVHIAAAQPPTDDPLELAG